MKKIVSLLLVLTLVVTFCACGSTKNATVQQSNSSQKQQLSESCDYVLCSGVDISGNSYELVANQTESSLGYEITVGIIKNNEWLYPLSTEFPFLGDGGLFHVDAPQGSESGSDLSCYKKIASMIHFIDTRNSTWTNSYDHTMIFFSCSCLKSYTVDCEEFTLLYRYSENNGNIHTENGKILLYSEVSGTSSGWLEDQVFDWCLLDVQTLDVRTFGSNIVGVRPESILSEGLIFASDQCFYNTNAQKAIDLSVYNIDMFYDSNIYFENGTCTFKAKNTLGTEFFITIDSSGNVLSEVKQ